MFLTGMNLDSVYNYMGITQVAIPSNRVNVSYGKQDELDKEIGLLEMVAIPSNRVNVSYLWVYLQTLGIY